MANANKKQESDALAAEWEAIQKQLAPLRAERRRLKESGKDFEEVDAEIRRLVRRTRRIEAKQAPRAPKGQGCVVKVARSSGSSGTIYQTYRDARLRPVQGGKASSK